MQKQQRFTIDGDALDPVDERSASRPANRAHGWIWNSTTQELIPVLDPDHPDYESNADTVAAAIRRWEQPKRKFVR